MQSIKIFIVSIILFIIAFRINSYSQSVQIIVVNLEQDSANSLIFDAYIKNNGITSWQYSKATYAWTYNTSILNGGTAGFSVVPGFCELPVGFQPPSALITNPNIIRTSSNLDGVGPTLAPGDSLRVSRFRLRTSAVSFAGLNHDLIWKIASTPYTRIYHWNGATGIEITTNKSYANYLTNNPLPVKMLSFTSCKNGRNVKLTWITTSEQNNKGFDIERKTNDNWEKVGFLNGKLYSNTQTTYIYIDEELNTGIYNYRLKQIDNNGNFDYLILNSTIEIGIPEKYIISQNYPNPFNPTTKINFELPFDSKVKIAVYDMLGRELKILINNELKKAGYYTIDFNANNLASGIYIYRMIANNLDKDFIFTKKMVIIK
jgi:hypothetical protein